MKLMKQEYIEGIYAGWLAKIIGIRLGAPIEGWTYDQIKNVYGKPSGYIVDYKDFSADDDSNGPLFFLRSLEDSKKWADLSAQDVAEALLNYASFERGFFWWGSYGVSTEHTAYLNLRNGITAPRSGSVEQNGSAVAEQIGGQIFIDTWGLVTPGNPDLAAALAEKAASITHGGNGVYGGIFIAACISYAFVEKDIHAIIRKGLSYIPEDCEYTKIVNEVVKFHEENPNDWEVCYKFIHDHYGYDKYPGACHIIPNTGVMILSLLYGNGDFTQTLNICNCCGWDTDCNVGNIATIMGVRNGLEGIDYDKWRKPINDFLVCSSVVGSLNIMDVPYGAMYVAKLAAILAGEELPAPFADIAEHKIDSCHFEYAGSTHAIRVKSDPLQDEPYPMTREYALINTDESAAIGTRSLKVVAKPMMPGENVYVYKKTYYQPKDFHNSRYDPTISPLVHAGQVIHGSAMLPSYGQPVAVSLYAREMRSGKVYHGEMITLQNDSWVTMAFKIPALEGSIIDEVGFCFHVQGERGAEKAVSVLIDDLYVDGSPDYTIEMENENEERWTPNRREISQFVKLKGLLYLEDGRLNLSCADFGEVYTGRHDWKNYTTTSYITPLVGEHHMVNVRVQGAIRSYAFALLPNGKVAFLKNEHGYRSLAEASFAWEVGKEYQVCVTVNENEMTAEIDGQTLLHYQDHENPYLEGGIGLSVQNGSRIQCRRIVVS